MNFQHELWTEKYRPKTIDEMVLPDSYRKEFKAIVTTKNLSNNLLFAGPPGGGKSTAARILTSPEGIVSNPDDNLLEINGSARESRGIAFIDDVIVPFLKVPPIGNDKYKVVYIDEADQLTEAAFNSLRGNIEKFTNTGRFIFTCNYLSKVPAPIQSRFQLYEFKKLTVDYITEFTKDVLRKENVTYTDDDLSFVISNLYPDVRKIISTLNTRSSSGTLTVNRSEMITEEKKVIAAFVDIIDGVMNGNGLNFSTNIDTISKLTSEKDLDYKSIYEVLFYERKIFAGAKIIINRYTNSHNDCMIPSMHFMAMVFECISVCKQYKNTVK